MNRLDAIGEQGKIVLVGFLLFLALWGVIDALHIQSDFAKFIASSVSTLWSILLFVVDPRKKTDVTSTAPATDAGSLSQPGDK